MGTLVVPAGCGSTSATPSATTSPDASRTRGVPAGGDDSASPAGNADDGGGVSEDASSSGADDAADGDDADASEPAFSDSDLMAQGCDLTRGATA